MVLESALINTQLYMVQIKGRVEQSDERSSAFLLELVVVALDYGRLFFLLLYIYIYIYIMTFLDLSHQKHLYFQIFYDNKSQPSDLVDRFYV